MNTDVYGHVGVRFADEGNVEKLGHFLLDSNVSVPVTTLIPNQNQGHNFTSDPCVQKVCCASL